VHDVFKYAETTLSAALGFAELAHCVTKLTTLGTNCVTHVPSQAPFTALTRVSKVPDKSKPRPPAEDTRLECMTSPADVEPPAVADAADSSRER